MKFSDRLRELRKKRGLTQLQLAEALKINRSTLAKYETGENEPDHQTMQQIADFFGVTVDFIIGNSDDPASSAESLPPTVRAWLRADTEGLSREEQKMLAEELTRYFEFRKHELLRRKKDQE